MKALFKSLVLGISLTVFTFSSFSQTVSREVLIEDTLHHFAENYDMIQKLIDSTSISGSSVSNQALFRRFARQELSSFFMTNFNAMLAGTINSSHLQGEYDDHFNSLKRSTGLMTRFSNWKISEASHSHTGHSHGAEAGNCDNVDFELGNWQHWNPFVGDVYCPAGHAAGCIQNVTAGTSGAGANAQHRIVTGGNDVDVAAVPRLNPRGGTYSIMLGDENGGGEVSMITHVAKITALKPYFTYDFAVVFNDPSHPVQEQPFFDVQFLDSNGVKIPSCGNYFVITGTGIPGFITTTGSSGFGTWRYKPWSRITVDLSNYIGHNITVKFTVGDCGYGGHDGRAYVDGSCFKPEIQKTQTCKGIELKADSGYLGYQWYGGSPLAILPGETKQDLTIAGPGIYQVKLISESGCTLFIDTLINDIYVILSQNITQVDPSCIGVNDGQLTINAFGGQAPYTYSIDGGATIVGTNNFTGLAPGSYTCIVYDSGGCSDTLTYTLTNPPDILPNLVITNALCFSECNGNVLAVPSGGTSPTGRYRVEFDNVFAPTKQRSNFCAGPHTVKVTDENGCFTVTPFVVGEPAAEVIDAIVRVNEKCFNGCDGSITVNDATATEYSVDDGATWQTSNVFNNLCAQAGPYAVAIKTANGCIGKRTEPITQPPPLVLTPIDDEFICLNKFATKRAVAVGGTPGYTYSWSDGSSAATMSVSPPTSTTYNVTVTDANGCTTSDEFNINLHPQPDVNFEFSPGPETDVFNTKVEFTNTTVYGAKLDWEWYIDVLGTYTTRDAYFEFPTNGGKRFVNCLKAENEQGCRDSICKELYIKYEVLLYVPNTFTPNGDELNDVLIPVVEGLKTEGYKMYIFNRWGELMYSTTDQAAGWDGNYQGKRVDEGAYIWRVVGVTKQTDEKYEKFGHVTILNKL
ncbi:MAG: gliding motility-associated C-terminal domain-containing protein [Flavobacteriales bacterium]